MKDCNFVSNNCLLFSFPGKVYYGLNKTQCSELHHVPITVVDCKVILQKFTFQKYSGPLRLIKLNNKVHYFVSSHGLIYARAHASSKDALLSSSLASAKSPFILSGVKNCFKGKEIGQWKNKIADETELFGNYRAHSGIRDGGSRIR